MNIAISMLGTASRPRLHRHHVRGAARNPVPTSAIHLPYSSDFQQTTVAIPTSASGCTSGSGHTQLDMVDGGGAPGSDRWGNARGRISTNQRRGSRTHHDTGVMCAGGKNTCPHEVAAARTRPVKHTAVQRECCPRKSVVKTRVKTSSRKDGVFPRAHEISWEW